MENNLIYHKCDKMNCCITISRYELVEDWDMEYDDGEISVTVSYFVKYCPFCGMKL